MQFTANAKQFNGAENQPCFLITVTELDALDGLPAFDFKLYCLLRAHMDYASGIVGGKRKLSYRMLAEWMTVEPEPGRHEHGSPSREKIRQSLGRLAKAGLTAETGQLTFRLPKARTDSSAPRSSNRAATGQQQGSNTRSSNLNIHQIIPKISCTYAENPESSHQISNPPATDCYRQSSNTHPESGIRIPGDDNPPLTPPFQADGQRAGVSTPSSTSPPGKPEREAKTRPKENSQDLFETFWQAYPRKVGKKAAQRVWEKIKDKHTVLDQILKALAWQSKQSQWLREGGRFIPHPATYLNQGRWEDEPPPKAETETSSLPLPLDLPVNLLAGLPVLTGDGRKTIQNLQEWLRDKEASLAGEVTA